MTTITHRPTLKDLAAEVGVSVCTASKAMRTGAGVAPKTVERVRTAADLIGYVPNNAARALVSQRTRTIGFLVSNSTNRFHATLLGAVTSVVQAEGYNIISGDSVDEHGHPHAAMESMFTRSLAQHRIAGAIVMGPVSQEAVRTFAQWKTPMVFVDVEPPALLGDMPAVLTDNVIGGHMAGSHFVEHGYRDFLFVGHPSSWKSWQGREDGFLAATRGHGTVEIVEGGYNADEAEAAIDRHLDQREGLPDAVFTTNELLLRGATAAFAKRGLRLGRDVAVISYDEFEWARHLDPPVTTVDQHVHELGIRAGSVLMDMCASLEVGEDPGPGQVLSLRPDLIVRQSCGCPASTPASTLATTDRKRSTRTIRQEA